MNVSCCQSMIFFRRGKIKMAFWVFLKGEWIRGEENRGGNGCLGCLVGR